MKMREKMREKNGFVAIALAFMLALILGSGTLACEDEGMLEKAGEKTDEAIDDLTHPGEGPIEEAARKAGEKADQVKEDIEGQ